MHYEDTCDGCGHDCDDEVMYEADDGMYCEGCMEDAEVMESDGDPALGYC